MAAQTEARTTAVDQHRRSFRVFVALLLGVRLALFTIVQPWTPSAESRVVLQGDGRAYHQLATTLLAHHRLAYTADSAPNALRTPGYPLFVAAFYACFGERPWVVLLAQIALDLSSCLLLYVLVERRAGPRAASFAALLFALDPFLSLFSATALLSDTLFVFLLLLAVWLLDRSLSEPDAKRSPAGTARTALALGLNVLIRPVSQFLVVVFLAILLIARRGTPARALRHAALFTLVFAAVLAPVLVRNHAVFGRVALSSSDSYNLLILNAGPLEMHRTGRDMHEVEHALRAEADSLAASTGADPAKLNDLEHAVFWRRVALDHIRRDPVTFVKVYAKGVVHMFGNLGTSVFSNAFGWPQTEFQLKRYASPAEALAAFVRTKGGAAIALAVVLAAWLLFTYATAAVGLWVVARRREWWGAAIVALAIGGYFVAVTGAAGLARFKMPVVPFYVAFSAVALAARFASRDGAGTGSSPR